MCTQPKSAKAIVLFLGLLFLTQIYFLAPAHAQNLMTNPNFEQGLTGWGLAHGTSAVVSDPTVPSAKLLRLMGAGWTAGTQDVSAVVKPGQTYTLTFQGRRSSSKVNGYVQAQFIDKSWNNISVPLVEVTSTTLSNYKMQFTVPAATKYVHIGAAQSSNGSLTDYTDFTNFSLTRNPLGPVNK